MAASGPEAIIHEGEFSRLFAQRAHGFLSFLNLLRLRHPRDWLNRHYAELVARAHDTETFLDDVGARNNKAYSTLTELVACLRGFGRVGATMKHLMRRFPRYNVALDAELGGAFFAETERTATFLNRSIQELTQAIHEELTELQVPIAVGPRADSTAFEESDRRSLPHNIDEVGVLEEERKIGELATQYLGVHDRFAWVGREVVEGHGALQAYVLQHLDEERARQFEGFVHSLQSKYDTYIGGTAHETQIAALKRMRGHISLCLHLLEMGTDLVHFYVRHENDVRCEGVKEDVARIVDKTAVLDRAVNYAFRFGRLILQAGRPFAEEVLGAFVQVQRLAVELPLDQTLHARPISLIVKIVHHYGTHVEMEIEGECCNASSLMEMIMLAGSRPQCRQIVFRGDARTLQDVRALFECGMGESGIASLPDVLGYLK